MIVEQRPEIKTPKVTLLSWANLPLETVYAVWEASKGERPLMTPQQVKDNVPPEDVRKLFRAVIMQKIPIGEHLDFVFMFENISVSWREQAVRHRIGTLPSPERIGADMVHMDTVPGLHDSSWWSQSMRIQDMGSFHDTRSYRVPETVIAKGDEAQALFEDTMAVIQSVYKRLLELGVPMEDARELMPLGAQHRMSWKLNISSLQHIVGKRGCWILQLGIWGPIIQGMIDELALKVDPIFRELVAPPCIDNNKATDAFKGCAFHEENRRRYTGDDKLPPCPLHFRQHYLPEQGASSVAIGNAHNPAVQAKYHLPMADAMRERVEDYRKFWGRDPYTGDRS
jgi:hypothetical protein